MYNDAEGYNKKITSASSARNVYFPAQPIAVTIHPACTEAKANQNPPVANPNAIVLATASPIPA